MQSCVRNMSSNMVAKLNHFEVNQKENKKTACYISKKRPEKQKNVWGFSQDT